MVGSGGEGTRDVTVLGARRAGRRVSVLRQGHEAVPRSPGRAGCKDRRGGKVGDVGLKPSISATKGDI